MNDRTGPKISSCASRPSSAHPPQRSAGCTTVGAVRSADHQSALAFAGLDGAQDLVELTLVDHRRNLARRILGGPIRNTSAHRNLAEDVLITCSSTIAREPPSTSGPGNRTPR